MALGSSSSEFSARINATVMNGDSFSLGLFFSSFSSFSSFLAGRKMLGRETARVGREKEEEKR